MYDLVDHTADIKVVIRSSDLAGLYASAVAMMREVLVGRSSVRDERTVTVPPDGDDPGERFYRFVRELVYLADTDHFVPHRLVTMDPPTVLGDTFDAHRHTFEHAPKAVTRHQYVFAFDDTEGCRAEMVLDL